VSTELNRLSPCRICGASPLRRIFDFLPNPYGDLFDLNCEVARNLPKHPISISRCDSCKLLQLTHETDLDSQYLEYLYLTGVTNNLSSFYNEIARRYIAELSLKKTKYIIDLGSNDGAFLRPFLDEGFSVLGVDPSRPAAATANQAGIQTINDYFSYKTVSDIKEMNVEIGLISVNYTLANVPKVSDFFSSINELAGEETYVSIVTGYHPEQFLVNMFDYIGHDHLSYFTIGDIDSLAQRFNFKLIDVEKIEHKGGSVRLLLARPHIQAKSSVFQNLQREKWIGTTSDSGILEMLSRVDISKQQLKSVLAGYKGKLIGGIGASISTSYLTVHYQITENISVLFDDDPRKKGRYSPGSGLEVKELAALASEGLDCVVILAWQHTDKLLNRLKEVGFRGRVLIPLPILRILEI